ncbi:MAG: response regulator [Dehalococcoidales bacterium]|jgi:DNA-binding NarL/FixJ family response regulator|nr:response regulator [Dehalococcoidales bacterium]
MQSQEKILIIDEDPVFIEALQRTLEAKGYRVMTTSNINLAKEMLAGDPDAIVIGTLYPAGQVFALHQWLKQNKKYSNIPVMIIDAPDSERSIRGLKKSEGMLLETEDYLTKPIEPAFILPRIQRLIELKFRKIRVLVADDHTMVRNGICAVLSLQKDIEVVAEATDGQDAVEKALRFAPNVALMDIVMPVMNGIEATRQIKLNCPATKVLILTQYDEEENMVVAKKAGAHGFIPKRAASSELLVGIRVVNAGSYFPNTFIDLPSSN